MSHKKDKLKIAFIGHKYIPSREGGVEIVVEELSTRMVEKGFDVTVYNRGRDVSGQKKDKAVANELYKGVKIKRALTINKKGLAAFSSSLFAGINAAFSDFDVVHFHAEGPCAAMWIPKLFGKKCIATVHGLDHKRAKWGRFASAYIKFGEKCAVRFADEIIVLSQNVQNYFLEKYGRATVFIPNGVNTAKPKAADIIQKQYNLQKDEYILFLARLVPEKGVRYLIDAFRQINTDKKLVIAGGSSDTDDFECQLIESAKQDKRIIFTGFVEGEVLTELYSNAYLYVLPSDLEGMPISLLEALSFGNCCLTSDIPECADVLQQNGVTFKAGNTKDLKEKLELLLNVPEKVLDLRQKASFVFEKYNWNDVVDKTLQLYGVQITAEKEKVSQRG